MALANRVGREGNMLFDGSSFVVGPRGQMIAQAPSGEAIILLASVNTDRCATSPARARFLPDRRPDAYDRGAVRLSESAPVAASASGESEGANNPEDAPSSSPEEEAR
jgi:N-carbamoylputrescine amidase